MTTSYHFHDHRLCGNSHMNIKKLTNIEKYGRLKLIVKKLKTNCFLDSKIVPIINKNTEYSSGHIKSQQKEVSISFFSCEHMVGVSAYIVARAQSPHQALTGIACKPRFAIRPELSGLRVLLNH